MQGTAPQESDVSALVAYLNSLRLPPWPVKSNDKVVATQVKRGEVLFDTLDCKLCHTPPTYTSPGTYDVGLGVGLGGTKFNPPSLRGVGSRATLFHDSRAESLTAVFSQYRHRLPRDLTVEEVKALVIFLKIL
jgi:cytochrome c peroxidase